MELIRGQCNLAPRHRGCVVTIGNYDGVHRGHQRVLNETRRRAAVAGLPSLAIIFEPHPAEFFLRDRAAPRLMRLREKLAAIAACGIDRVLCLRFDEAVASMPAEVFVERLLLERLEVRGVVVGDDCTFGARRRGDFAMLQRYAAAHGFWAVALPTFELDGVRVSSSRVREALMAGDLAVAERLLGRPYTMSGRVAHGNKLGRVLGFPTANIYLHRRAVPITGIYIVRMRGVDTSPLGGAADVGMRPTVGGTRSLLEVHLLDFNRDIYGRHVEVEFMRKLRDEQHYDSLGPLKRQIALDVEQARAYFARHAAPPQKDRECL